MKFFSKYVLALIYTLSLIFAGISVGSASVGKVTVVEGSVDVLKAKKAEVTPVKVGDPVDIGDIYRTKTGSYAEIKFYNDSILRIGARTRVEIKEYMVEKERTSQVMKLHRGRIQAIATEEIVKKAAALVEGHKFEVHTPTAVAGIRGSNMLVGFSQGTTVVVFIKGRGYVFNPAQPHIILPISQGQVSFIKGDLPPSPPTKAPENFIKEEGRAFLRIEEVKKEEKREPSEEVRVTVTTTPDVGPSAPDVPVREAAIEDYAALRDIAFYERGFETLLPREVVGVSFVRTLAEIEPPRLPFYGVKKETLLEGALQIDTNKGRFLGRVDEKGRGDFSFSVQFPQLDSLPSPYIVSGILEGTSDKAGAFFGVQRSIIGSVDTLLSSFYVEGSTLYFLTGQGSGSYEANVLSSTGRLVRSEPIGNLSLKIPPGGNLLSALKDKVKSITFGSGPVTYSSFYSPPPENYFLRLDTGLLAGLFATQFYLSHQNQSPWRFSYDWFLPTQTSFEFQWLFGQAVWDYTDPTKGIGRGNLELIGYINNIGPIIGEATANIASRFYDSRDMLLVSSGTYIADVASFMVSSGVLPTSGFYEFRTEDGTVGFFRGSGPSQMAGFVVGKGDIWSSPSPIRFVGLYSPEKKKDFFFLDFVTADLNGVSPNYAFGFPVFKAGYALENTDCYGGIIGASIKDKFIAEGLAFYAKKIGNEYEVGYFKLSDLEGSFFPEIGSYTASGKIEISKLGTTNTLPDSMEHDDVILKVGSGPISGYLVVGTVSPSSTQWTLLMSALSANYTSVPTGNWVSKVGSFEAEKFWDFWYVNLFLGDLRGDAWDSLTRTFSATLSGTEINIESEPEGNYLFLHENAITFRGIFGEEKALGVGTGIVDESKKKPLNLANHFGVFGDALSVYTPISGNLYIREFIQKVQVDGHEEWHEDRRFLVVTEGMGYGIFKDSYRGEEAYYFPDGTMVEIDMGGKAIFRYGWRNIEYIRHDHLKRSQWLIPDDPTFQVWYSKFPNVKLLEKASGRVLGAIGGLGYPWGDKGTDLTIIGRYDGSEYPFFFNTPPLLGRFYDPENRREIGAYVLTLGGYVTGDERMSLWGRGLYIKDDGQEAGIFVFQDLEATFFRGIDMWQAKATIVREAVSSSNGASV
ncbi:MAG: FecR family protein, partial [Desulfobacterota bacterium]|nr:FecR family protein [Thermodesulfobacteriota bacterium]